MLGFYYKLAVFHHCTSIISINRLILATLNSFALYLELSQGFSMCFLCSLSLYSAL